MKTINEDHLRFAVFVGRVPPRPLTATFVVKAGFRLRPRGVAELLPEEEQPEFSGDQFYADDPAQGLRYASDFAWFKPGADLLAAGHCHAPGGDSVTRAEVAFGVGQYAKRLLVSGDRFWGKDAVGSWVSAPRPFTSMALNWARSFGGPGDRRNLAGRGAAPVTLEDGTTVHPLPNIESPRSLVTSPDDKPEPAGFAPVDPTSSMRAVKRATYDQHWLEQRWPWLPDDFDWTFFCAAPRDQQLPGAFLRGDETLHFNGMHPQFQSYECRMAGDRVRLFVKRRRNATLLFEEVELRLDTLFADIDVEKVTLVWRGVTAADSMKLREFEEAFVLREPVSAPLAESLSEYEELYETRKAYLSKADRVQVQRITPITVPTPRIPDTSWTDRFPDQIPAPIPNEPDQTADMEWAKALGGDVRPTESTRQAPPVEPTPVEADALIKAEIEKLGALQPGLARVFSNATPELAALDKEFEEDDKNVSPGLADDIPDEPEDDGWSAERVRKHAADGGDFDGQDLSGLDLSNVDFSGLSLREAVLDDARLIHCIFDDADLCDTSLSKTTLHQSTFRRANLKGADFSGVVAIGSAWTGATLDATEFSGARLPGADFRTCRGKQPSFDNCDLAKAAFERCELDQADYTSALLNAANFAGAVLPDAGFYKAVASDVIFEDAQIPRGRFNDAQLYRSNFTRCLLDDSVMENAGLADCDFTEARLNRTIFTGARTPRAVFAQAHCLNAKFDDASARETRFVETNLFRATFENADLTGAWFWDCNCYQAEFYQTIIDGTIFELTNLKGTKLA
jgi:uncharacterized protein YjbI with pentapeptide repeats